MEMHDVNSRIADVIEQIKECKLNESWDAYVELLTQTYYFVKHSVPLLKVAIENSDNSSFVERTKAHIAEESGHDLIVLDDLKRLGVEVDERMEWSWTKNFYSYQYELVRNEGELLLGYILALEGIAVHAKPLLASKEEKYGKRATKFVRLHVEEDQDHLPEAFAQIKASKMQNEIFANFNHTIDEYLKFVNMIQQISVRDRNIA